MDLNTICKVIDQTVQNKNYKATILEYINKLTENEHLEFEKTGELVLSDIKMNEYLALRVYGPEIIIVEIEYRNKEEKNSYFLSISIEEDDNVYVEEAMDNPKFSTKKEETYKEDKLFCCYDVKEEKEENMIDIREMIISDENVAYVCMKQVKDNAKLKEEYLIDEIECPYTFKTNENCKSKKIVKISEKQYQKAIESILGEEKKPKSILGKIRNRKNK